MSLLVASAPSAYWYGTRGAGLVALLLLTASVVIGVVDLSRWQSERWPRFVVDGLHRTVSMLAVAMVAIHVLTTVADGFTPIGLQDAVIPFASPYRRLWLGLGTLAFDLLLAVTLTSVLRRRIGQRTWRAVHWTAYACWPLALVHGLGTGSDTPVPWALMLTATCLFAVLIAVGWRVAAASAADPRMRGLAGSLGAAALLALVLWVAAGPLGPNWARRAGTPAAVLASVGSGRRFVHRRRKRLLAPDPVFVSPRRGGPPARRAGLRACCGGHSHLPSRRTEGDARDPDRGPAAGWGRRRDAGEPRDARSAERAVAVPRPAWSSFGVAI